MKLSQALALFPLALALASCGGGGGGGNTAGYPDVEPLVPPSRATEVEIDTIVLSDFKFSTSSRSGVVPTRCDGVNCVLSDPFTGEPTPLPIDESDLTEGFEKNGRVNGPAKRSLQDGTTSATFYAYWMGDSSFAVVDSSSFEPGVGRTQMFFSAVSGNDTGHAPLGNATYTGKAVAISTGDTHDNPGDVYHGDFSLSYDFSGRSIEMDLDFDDFDYEFNPTTVYDDGTFSRSTTDGGNLRGEFFGANANEVAGTFDLPSDELVGAFGGKKNP